MKTQLKALFPQVMTGIAVMFFIAAPVIWLAPKPTRSIEPGAGGH